MRDPHVVELRYRLVPGESASFKNPPPLECETATFKLRLADEQVDVTMKAHFATEQEAREHVEPYLRAWEIHTALQEDGYAAIRFDFEKSEVVDRNPPLPGEPQTVYAQAVSIGLSVASASLHVQHSMYPPAPARFEATREVELLWNRYRNYQKGRESLETLANFALTTIEGLFHGPGKRKKAAQALKIEFCILRRMGKLSSARGSEMTARKYPAVKFGPLSEAEIRWLRAAVLKVILRLGEYYADPASPLSKITMNDLPRLALAAP